MDQEQTNDKSKYYELYEYYNHTIDDYINLKIQLAKYIHKGKLSEFVIGKARVANKINGPTKHIDMTYSRVQAMSNTKWKRTKSQKYKLNNTTDHIFGFRYAHGINKKTQEENFLSWIDKGMANIYAPHQNPMIITTQVGIWSIERILVDEGSGLSILFSNCIESMKLPQDVITFDIGDMYGINANNSSTACIILLGVTVMGKGLTIDFLLMDYKYHHNTILG